MKLFSETMLQSNLKGHWGAS